jgi:hypothetical protein
MQNGGPLIKSIDGAQRRICDGVIAAECDGSVTVEQYLFYARLNFFARRAARRYPKVSGIG